MKPFDKIVAVRNLAGITSVQKVILLTIATHLGEHEITFVSTRTLQRECCIAGPQNLQANLHVLSRLGVLTIHSPNENFKTNQYEIHFDRIKELIEKSHAANGALALTESKQAANGALAGCLRSVSGVLTERYPKRNINKNKKNEKGAARVFSVDKRETFDVEQRERGAKAARQILRDMGIRKGGDNDN